MSPTMTEIDPDLEEIEKSLITEDDEPVDNMFSAKQQRLLVEPLYTAWTPPPSDEDREISGQLRPFLADANVGIFFSVHEKPLVPDMFLSLDVDINPEWIAREHRSYFVWRFGKVPDVVVEIVSNRKGGEMQSKRKKYAQMGVPYYVVFDPFGVLKGEPLYVYEVGFVKHYRRRDDYSLPGVGLSLTLWQGRYEAKDETWLRWLDATGNLIPTAKEFADQAKHHADQAKHRADEAEHRAGEAEHRAGEAEHRAGEAEHRADEAEHRAEEAEQNMTREVEARQRAESELAQLRAELERLKHR